MTYYKEPEEPLDEIPNVPSAADRNRRQANVLAISLAAAFAILIPLVYWLISSWLGGGSMPRTDLGGTTNDGVRTRVIILDPPR